ncbi:MAG: acyltransferase [Lachnospiraceae bacterium]|nr:acyltransferase [Lachnospiraceae bacterium]
MKSLKDKSAYLLLGILIFAALGITVYRNLAYLYELQGSLVDLSVCEMEVSGYEVTAPPESDGMNFTAVGKDFHVTGEDPQLMLTLPAETPIGGIAIDFETFGDNLLPVQVFYAKDWESYAEKNSVKGELKAGETRLLLPIPQGAYCALRLDIDGDFRLAGITGCSDPMKVTAYVSGETLNTCLWFFPAVTVGFCLIFWAHGVRIREGGFTAAGYVKNVFLGAEPAKDREVYLDYLRILAAVFVILAHTCSPMVDLADTSWKKFVLVCGLSLGLSCNPLYVMLSGTLLLDTKGKQEERVGTFYVRRASKVIIPMIAYYLLILSLNNEVQFLPPTNVTASLKRIVTGAPDAGPHLWLIYTIVSLYLVTPFFRIMMQHMGDRLLFSLAGVIVVLNMLTTYLPLFGMTFGASTFLAGWEGIFLLGFILARQNEFAGASRRNRLIMLAAVVSYLIMVSAVFRDASWMNYVYNGTPTMVVTACGIFTLFQANKDKFRGKSNVLVRLCAKYSYSIILIHWYALFVVVQGRLHITALRFGCIGGIAASVLATVVVCLVIAVVFDNTVVIVCSVIFDKITKRLTVRN